MEIQKGNSTYTGVIEIDGKLACENCKTVDPKGTMVMHMDGTKTYTSIYKCECGSKIAVTTKRSGESLAYWADDDYEEEQEEIQP